MASEARSLPGVAVEGEAPSRSGIEVVRRQSTSWAASDLDMEMGDSPSGTVPMEGTGLPAAFVRHAVLSDSGSSSSEEGGFTQVKPRRDHRRAVASSSAGKSEAANLRPGVKPGTGKRPAPRAAGGDGVAAKAKRPTDSPQKGGKAGPGAAGKRAGVASRPDVRVGAVGVIYLTAVLDSEGKELPRAAVTRAVIAVVDVDSVLAMMKRSRNWEVTFTTVEALDAFIALRQLKVEGGQGATIDIRRLAEKGPGGRIAWCRPTRMVRVHWLPVYIPDEVVRDLLSPLKVLGITPEKSSTEGFYNGVRRLRVEGAGVDNLPHVVTVRYAGESFPCLLTVPGRPPMCFRCRQIGHLRGECGLQVGAGGSYAERVAGVRKTAAEGKGAATPGTSPVRSTEGGGEVTEVTPPVAVGDAEGAPPQVSPPAAPAEPEPEAGIPQRRASGGERQADVPRVDRGVTRRSGSRPVSADRGSDGGELSVAGGPVPGDVPVVVASRGGAERRVTRGERRGGKRSASQPGEASPDVKASSVPSERGRAHVQAAVMPSPSAERWARERKGKGKKVPRIGSQSPAKVR